MLTLLRDREAMTARAEVAETSRALLTLVREPIVPAPGIYQNVPIETYHGWRAVGSSWFKHLRRSPAHLQAYLEHGDGDSPDKLMGRAFHAAVLEPDQFERRYLRADRCEGVTKSKERCKNPGTSYRGVEGWTCGVHGSGVSDAGITIVPPADYDRVLRMRDSVFAHRSAAEMLRGLGPVELSIVWVDEDTGVLCKARPDKYVAKNGGGVADPKKTRDASDLGFARAIDTYGYHVQAAHYLRGLRACDIAARYFCNIAVEDEPPYAVNTVQLEECGSGALDYGISIVRKYLPIYAECEQRGEWPAYGHDVKPITLPNYALYRTEEELSA